jgi:extradiol dioxygenase family protein
MTAALRPFHLALPVNDLAAAETFYCGLLGCHKGRVAARWIDLDFYGHQVTLHLVDNYDAKSSCNHVDGDAVPASHFGVILDWNEWQDFADRLTASNCDFLLAPHTRFSGQIGEQATLFVTDPSGNALEFKSFADPRQLFAV